MPNTTTGGLLRQTRHVNKALSERIKQIGHRAEESEIKKLQEMMEKLTFDCYDKAVLQQPYANETVRHDVFGDGDTRKVGTVNGNFGQIDQANGKLLGVHYQTRNPLTPSSFTPTVDVDAGYNVTYDQKANAWDISFKGMSDGYPSTETFIEDPSGQRIMLGYKYEEGSPGRKLWGDADTKVFDGKARVYLDKDHNFKSGTITQEGRTTPAQIVPKLNTGSTTP